ncbi:MAG: ABC transporter ATP-binding protein [Imperialibacter sp.]|uniref:ABC transporter ATP-binding protein n=1 Tax=Imperialibacter sp. TaxID=2038411 RepID=UPI0032EC6816
MKEVQIEVSGVVKHFKEVKAVNGIDLTIYKGEFVALLGPNGAGKTTLVEMIEGIQKPDAGQIRLKGMTWVQHAKQLHQIIGLSLQETRFIEKLRVRETLELFASFYGLGSERVEEVLELVNLTEKQEAFTDKLSGGQRQRMALGISLLNEPEILLLDEPTTGLDPNARRELWEILLNLRKRKGTTLILTTHYMEEAAYLCDRIVIMDQGRILAEGTLKQLLSKHVKGEIIDFTVDRPMERDVLPGQQAILNYTFDKDTLSGELLVTDIVKFLPDFLLYVQQEKIRIDSLECRKMTLDDLFTSMTGRHINQ